MGSYAAEGWTRLGPTGTEGGQAGEGHQNPPPPATGLRGWDSAPMAAGSHGQLCVLERPLQPGSCLFVLLSVLLSARTVAQGPGCWCGVRSSPQSPGVWVQLTQWLLAGTGMSPGALVPSELVWHLGQLPP